MGVEESEIIANPDSQENVAYRLVLALELFVGGLDVGNQKLMPAGTSGWVCHHAGCHGLLSNSICYIPYSKSPT